MFEEGSERVHCQSLTVGYTLLLYLLSSKPHDGNLLYFMIFTFVQ